MLRMGQRIWKSTLKLKAATKNTGWSLLHQVRGELIKCGLRLLSETSLIVTWKRSWELSGEPGPCPWQIGKGSSGRLWNISVGELQWSGWQACKQEGKVSKILLSYFILFSNSFKKLQCCLAFLKTQWENGKLPRKYMFPCCRWGCRGSFSSKWSIWPKLMANSVAESKFQSSQNRVISCCHAPDRVIPGFEFWLF